jgi:hypothetical protein
MNLGYEDIELVGDIVDIEVQLTERIEDIFRGKVLDIEVSDEGDDFVAFAALERNFDGSRIVTGVVCLVRGQEGGPPHYRIKEMSENEDPVASFASERILDLLTEPLTDGAAKWRHRCLTGEPFPDLIVHLGHH